MSERKLEHFVMDVEERRRAVARQRWAPCNEHREELEKALAALADFHGSLAHLLATLDQSLMDDDYPRDESGALLKSENEERQHLTRQLQEYAQDTIKEWMRLPVLEDVAGIEMQVRMRWQMDGTALAEDVANGGYDLGRFRFTVTVEDLGQLPPPGPENDSALQIEMQVEEALLWHPRTMRDVRPGDVVRLAGAPEGTEVSVEIVSPVLPWHVHPQASQYRPNESPAEWSSVRVRFVGRTDLLTFDPDMAILIQLTQTEIDAADLLGWEHRIKMSS